MHWRYTAGLVMAYVATALLAACEIRPDVRTDGDPSIDLASYQTFGFFEKLSTDQGSYGTMLTARLKDSTKRQLEQRGYHYATSNPQLLVNFNVNIKDMQSVESTPAMSGYYGYRAGMYGMWAGYPMDVRTVNYKDGTLAIDIVDAARRQLVWQGVAQGRISREALKDPAPAIERVVGEVFARYPIPSAVSDE